MNVLDQYLHQNRARFERDLSEWLTIPSISADPDYAADVRRAGNWLAEKIRNLGLPAEIIETCGHPLVFAQTPKVEGAPTVLVYGHYDVQPPDPLDEWKSPPFQPTVRDGSVYARGATDDKGQMLTHLLSVEAWIKTVGSLPLQIKFLIEGEEESGSSGINEFLAGKYDRDSFKALDKVAADIVVISDTAQYARGVPAITYGLRGICYFELKLKGPSQDLHSGDFGGTVTNPANALAQMLSAVIDSQGRIQVPGFYDDVIPLTEREKEQFQDLNFDDQTFMRKTGVSALNGEHGYTTLQRRWSRPTFDINGLTSGYQGQGSKTVLPYRASAKFSFRLVPNQNPQRIESELQTMMARLCPPGLEMELLNRHGAPGVVLSLDSPFMQAASQAIEHGFGAKPVFIRSGGSIPIVNAFKQMLGIDTLLLGWGQDDDNLHSPNEKFSLEDFYRGIRSSAQLWTELSKIPL